MRLSILGAAGKVGRLTVAEALARGHHVRALARTPARIPLTPGPGSLERVAGDVLDPSAVERAVAGADAVVCTFGAPLTWETITREPTICERGTRTALEAMARAGVDRLICMTAIGLGESRTRGRWVFRSIIRPLLLGRIYADRERQERLVRASGVRWSLVRPAELTDAPAGPWRAVDPDDHTGAEPARVPRATVAGFLMHEAATGEFLGRAPILTAGQGPASIHEDAVTPLRSRDIQERNDR
ncbi:MAG: NAD(P)H-binding protein [Planctomycetota bacterium]|nr:NAD(P)H-binding protein [Planctomycetota bacterium]